VFSARGYELSPSADLARSRTKQAENSRLGGSVVIVSTMAFSARNPALSSAKQQPWLITNLRLRAARKKATVMKAKVEIDCTPEEARAFFGLPDVRALNETLVGEMKARLDANLNMAASDELLKGWMTFGGQASEQFLRMLGDLAPSAKAKNSGGG
jgi:hypothetical protein